MINLFGDVFTHVAEKVRAAHSGVQVSSAYPDGPASFPIEVITQIDNHVYQRMRTANIENAVTVTFETQIYSNKSPGKQQEAEAIAATSDAAFLECGFTRTMYSPVANLNDATVYRVVCRYEAVIGPNGENKYLIYQS